VYNKVVYALGKSDKPFEAEVMHRLLEPALDILTRNHAHTQLQLEHLSQIYPLVSDLWMSGDQNYRETVQEFIVQLTDRECKKKPEIIPMYSTLLHQACLFVLQGHDDVVYSGTFAPDGGLLASASSDQTIRVWDV